MFATYNATLTAATGYRYRWSFNDTRVTGWDIVNRRWGSVTPTGTFPVPGANMTLNI